MKSFFLIIILISSIAISPYVLYGQDDMEKLMAAQEKPQKEFVTASFKGTRLINLHTVETLGKRVLEFRISHRFASVNTGPNNLYGLEGPAYIRLALEYSHNGRLMFGAGRSSSGKFIDVFAKYRVLRQTVDNEMPVSLTAVFSTNLTTQQTLVNSTVANEQYDHFSQRLVYMSQLIIGRKFNNALSLQISPIYIHYNMVSQIMDQNDIFALGFSGRYKVSKRIAITAEYVLRLNKYSLDFSTYYNSAGIGVDIETGGHVFQIFFTNSYAMNEVMLIPYTNTNWNNGGFRLGFNITRAFSLAKR